MVLGRVTDTLCDLVRLCSAQSMQSIEISWGTLYLYAACSFNILRIHDFSISVKQFVGNVGSKHFILQFHTSLFDKYFAVSSLHPTWSGRFAFFLRIFDSRCERWPLVAESDDCRLWPFPSTPAVNVCCLPECLLTAWELWQKQCTGYDPYADSIRTSDSREPLGLLSSSGLSPTVF